MTNTGYYDSWRTSRLRPLTRHLKLAGPSGHNNIFQEPIGIVLTSEYSLRYCEVG